MSSIGGLYIKNDGYNQRDKGIGKRITEYLNDKKEVQEVSILKLYKRGIKK